MISHDFAKAFWGEEDYIHSVEMCYPDTVKPTKEELKESEDNEWENYQLVWKFHLQQMVLEKEPLKYIERFLK